MFLYLGRQKARMSTADTNALSSYKGRGGGGLLHKTHDLVSDLCLVCSCGRRGISEVSEHVGEGHCQCLWTDGQESTAEDGLFDQGNSCLGEGAVIIERGK